MPATPGTPDYYRSWASEYARPIEKDTFDAHAAGADWLDEVVSNPIRPAAYPITHAGSFASRPTWPDGHSPAPLAGWPGQSDDQEDDIDRDGELPEDEPIDGDDYDPNDVGLHPGDRTIEDDRDLYGV